MFWDQFWPQLIATLIGVAMGIPAALWISRFREEQSRKDSVQKILVLLRDELLFNKNQLEDWKNANAPDYRKSTGTYAVTKDELWKAFSDGGELEWIKDIELLAILADTYFTLNHARELEGINLALSPKHLIIQTGMDKDTVNSMFRRAIISSVKAIDLALHEIDNHVNKDET